VDDALNQARTLLAPDGGGDSEEASEAAFQGGYKGVTQPTL
jgi:hypothetical protein